MTRRNGHAREQLRWAAFRACAGAEHLPPMPACGGGQLWTPRARQNWPTRNLIATVPGGEAVSHPAETCRQVSLFSGGSHISQKMI